MPTYDSTWFIPPAPLARVTLSDRASGVTRLNIPMLLDTGADVTLVPKSVIDELGLDTLSEKQYELVGFDGSISLAPVVQIDLLFLGRTFRRQFLIIDQEWGILGRNILNTMRLMFDGPRLTWDEFKSKNR